MAKFAATSHELVFSSKPLKRRHFLLRGADCRRQPLRLPRSASPQALAAADAPPPGLLQQRSRAGAAVGRGGSGREGGRERGGPRDSFLPLSLPRPAAARSGPWPAAAAGKAPRRARLGRQVPPGAASPGPRVRASPGAGAGPWARRRRW